ncbi:PfkB family carbohydrate kinase [Microbacterium schleiferi]|uniref:Ribokinase n=1 Tax=Microbacterium schleiferi TaxID=69362 RepID=A0ABU7V9D3_9MICO
MTSRGLGPLCVVGSINVDISVTVGELPIPGETVRGRGPIRGAGGKGANQAAAAARLGAAVRMLGAVGDDTDGQAMVENLRRAGVDTSGIRVVAEPTGTALITVDAAGENTIVVCAGANDAVEAAGPFASDEAVLAQLEIPPHAIEALAASVPGFFALNAAPARDVRPSVLRRADLVIVNDAEFAALPAVSAARLVVVTHGARGASLWREGERVLTAPSPAVEAVSAVGAGDAFSAAITLAVHAGWSDEVALAAACAVGADAVTHVGAQPRLRSLAEYR